MSEGRGPSRTSTAAELKATDSSRRIEVAIGTWTFAFVVGGASSTRCVLRDLAATVGGVTGVDHTSALAAVLAALSPGDVLEATA